MVDIGSRDGATIAAEIGPAGVVEVNRVGVADGGGGVGGGAGSDRGLKGRTGRADELFADLQGCRPAA